MAPIHWPELCCRSPKSTSERCGSAGASPRAPRTVSAASGANSTTSTIAAPSSPTVSVISCIRRDRDLEVDPPFTPVLWLLLWVTLAAGFIEGYVVMGSYTFQALPAVNEFFFPTPVTQGSGIWGQVSQPPSIDSTASNQQQQQQHPMHGVTTPQLLPSYTLSTAHINHTAHDLLQDDAEAGRRAHALYCTWTTPGYLSLIPQLTPIFSAAAAAVISSRYGRRACIWAGTALCVMAQLVLGLSHWYAMFMVGFGLAYGASAVLHTALLLEDAEIAPPRFRGSFMAANLLGQSVGWLTAAMLAAVFVDKGQWGWRMLYGLGALPGVLLLLVLPWLPETPNSLVLRGKPEEARQALRTIRGPFHGVGRELADIVAAAGPNPTLGSQLRTFFSREQRAPLLLTLILLLAQELHGRQYLERFVNSLGALLSTREVAMGTARYIILATSQMIGAILAAVFVDRAGRRFMLAACSAVAAVCFTGMAVLLSRWLPHVQMGLPPAVAALVVMFSLVEVSAAAGWLATYAAITAELHCLRTRAVAVAFTVSGTWVLTYLRFWARAPMLCAMKWGALLFFAGCNAANVVVVLLLLPETKQLPLERIKNVWARHWLWKRFSSNHRPLGLDPTCPGGFGLSRGHTNSQSIHVSSELPSRGNSSNVGSAAAATGSAGDLVSSPKAGSGSAGVASSYAAAPSAAAGLASSLGGTPTSRAAGAILGFGVDSDPAKHENAGAAAAQPHKNRSYQGFRPLRASWFGVVHGVQRMLFDRSARARGSASRERNGVQPSGPSAVALQMADD